MGKGICGSGEKIVYAWGRNAPELKLPDGIYCSIVKYTHKTVSLMKQLETTKTQ